MRLDRLDQKQQINATILPVAAESHRLITWGRAGLLILLGLGLGCLLVEVALRCLTPFFPYQTEPYLAQKAWLWLKIGVPQFVTEHSALWEPDDYLRDRLKPNVNTVIRGNPEYPAWPVKTDSLGLGLVGFRDTWPKQEPYAVVLGDSFGFGMGVTQEQIWSEQVEQETALPFFNLSQTGASSLQEARIYRRYGRHIPAKVVFWLFFQNDLKDNLRFARWLNPQANITEAARPTRQACAHSIHNFLNHYSLAYELILFSQRACHYSNLTPYPRYHDSQLSLTFCLDHDICDLEVQTHMLSDGWPLTRQALEDTLVQLPSGTSLVVVIVPSKEQVYETKFKQVTTLPPNYNIDQLIEPLRQFCAAVQLHCLDLTPAFRTEAEKGQQLYFPVDIHWNATGHTLVAQEVKNYLQQKNLLP